MTHRTLRDASSTHPTHPASAHDPQQPTARGRASTTERPSKKGGSTMQPTDNGYRLVDPIQTS